MRDSVMRAWRSSRVAAARFRRDRRRPTAFAADVAAVLPTPVTARRQPRRLQATASPSRTFSNFPQSILAQTPCRRCDVPFTFRQQFSSRADAAFMRTSHRAMPPISRLLVIAASRPRCLIFFRDATADFISRCPPSLFATLYFTPLFDIFFIFVFRRRRRRYAVTFVLRFRVLATPFIEAEAAFADTPQQFGLYFACFPPIIHHYETCQRAAR
jgi:hypothetical protein